MTERPQKPRPIDKLRDSAGSMEIRTPDDNSPIKEFISANEKLLVVKGKGVYEVRLADQIDPERKNINIPNTAQRLFPYGADDAWVGAILLTAHHLLNGSIEQDKVNSDEAFNLVMKIAENISSAYQLHDAYIQSESEIISEIDTAIRPDRSIIVPAIEHLESRCNEFIRRLDRAFHELFRLVKMFYKDVGSGGWDSLKKIIDDEPHDTDNFPTFLEDALPFLHLIRNARNCVEHPTPEKRLIVIDFTLDHTNTLTPPTIQIAHPNTPLEKVLINSFITNALPKVVSTVELMIVFLCARHAKVVAGMQPQVIEIPPKHRRSPHVRYGYGVSMGGKLVPIS